MKKILLMCVMAIIFCISVNAHANEDMFKPVKAEVFYYGWDVETRTRLSPDDVRNRYWTKINIVNEHEVEQFIKWLELDKMTKISVHEEDTRLVIDLYDLNGKRVTYYASTFNLCSEDSVFKRRIDKEFKEKFTFQANGL